MGKVLIVEDDADVRKLYAQVLAELGHQVAEAATGLEAIDEVRREQPELVVLDLALPEMNGYEFIARIRRSSQYGDLPIIAISGSATGRHSLRVGADAYLAKPFEIEQLIQEVQRHLPA